MKKKKVALGLSGGVDSSVSAKLLLDQGGEVTGIYLVGFCEQGGEEAKKVADARRVAAQLGIELRLVDLGEGRRERLRKYFYQTYQKGRTPNICSVCNREIKFGAFYDWAMSEGFDYIATGHYARTNLFGPEEKLPCLYTARDQKKDQTYFLALVEPEKWQRVIFPVGDLLKSEVRELARKWQLPVAEKKDSQDICFFGQRGGRNFLCQKISPRVGKVKLVSGEVIGEHMGVELYTIGQRHGLKISQNRPDMPELYVVGKNLAENELVMGEREEAKTAVLRLKSWFSTAKWLKWVDEGQLRVRIRHQGEMHTVCSIQDTVCGGECLVKLKERVFAPSAGQFAVFYRLDLKGEGFYCLGGMEII